MNNILQDNLQKIAEILRVEIPNDKAIESINNMISQRSLFEERFFGENHYYPPYIGRLKEGYDYIQFFMENQGVYELYVHKDELEEEDPMVYYSGGGIENVEPDGYSSFSTEILKILEDFMIDGAFNPEYMQEDKRDDFICRVCNKKVSYIDGDNIIEICQECSDIYDVDKIWEDYYDEKIKPEEMNNCDLNGYKIE